MTWGSIIMGAGVAAVLFAGCAEGDRWTTAHPEAIPPLERGVRHGQRFLFAEALAAIDSALAIDSTFAAAWGRRALLLYNTGNQTDARTVIARATALALSASAHERDLIRLWSYRINDDRDAEAALLDSLLVSHPRDPELYLMRGQCYELSRAYEAAVQMYAASVERDTGFALGVMSLGYTYSILGEQEKAVEFMQRYIRMAPNEPDPHASYADILVRAGRYDEALQQYREALEVKPDYWYAVREIGTVYQIQGRLRDAERQYEAAVKMLPPSMAAEAGLLRLRGALDLQRGRYDDAIALFHAARAVDANALEHAYALVIAFSRSGRFAEAHALIDSTYHEIERRELTASQVIEGYHLMRARVLTEEGRLAEAEEACRQAMENSTPLLRGRAYVQLARISTKATNWEEAFDAIESALAVNPNAPEALLALVRVYAGMGDRTMASEIGRRLRDLWRNADADFKPLQELQETLAVAGARPV